MSLAGARAPAAAPARGLPPVDGRARLEAASAPKSPPIPAAPAPTPELAGPGPPPRPVPVKLSAGEVPTDAARVQETSRAKGPTGGEQAPRPRPPDGPASLPALSAHPPEGPVDADEPEGLPFEGSDAGEEALPVLDLDRLDGDAHARAEAREAAAGRARIRSEMKVLPRPAPRPADPLLVIGAPPLPDLPPLPPLVEAEQAGSSGPVGRVRYALSAPRLARSQRLVIAALGRFLARARRHETVAVAALGRGARLHGLAPAEAGELVEAADADQAGADERKARADERKAEQHLASEACLAARDRAARGLAALEAEHAPLASRHTSPPGLTWPTNSRMAGPESASACITPKQITPSNPLRGNGSCVTVRHHPKCNGPCPGPGLDDRRPE